MKTENIKQVNADVWSTYCADYRTRANETKRADIVDVDYANSMILRSVLTSEIVGIVDYYHSGRRDYWIFQNLSAEKITYKVNAK